MESKLPRAVLGVLVGHRLRGQRRHLPDHLAQPPGQPRHHRGQRRRQRRGGLRDRDPGRRGLPVSVAAVLGAVLVSALVRQQAGSVAGNRLVLVGVGLSAAMFSVIQYLFTRADEWDTQLVLHWLTGSLNRVDWPTIRILSVLLLLLAPFVLLALAVQPGGRARGGRGRRAGGHPATLRRPAPGRRAAGRPSGSRRRDRSPSWRSSPARSPGRSTAAGPPSSARAWWAR